MGFTDIVITAIFSISCLYFTLRLIVKSLEVNSMYDIDKRVEESSNGKIRPERHTQSIERN